ncbi:hypothetical protein PVAP13_8NG267200 [Panicum virgatum]|uniref:Gelsolin-like domain-containing protein n=1 Tax=Panicum virgatum TaxID=38727 RepID=A0A8T0PCQ7_PANVG|nr:hypothetical protein PVAP13_8NG267200 [Panicum virgatum]
MLSDQFSTSYSQIRSLGHKRKGQKQNNFEAYWEENPSIQAKKWCEKLKVIPIFSHASCQKQVKGIHHFTQDDLMTEDVFVLDCPTSIFVWVGQQVDVTRVLHEAC